MLIFSAPESGEQHGYFDTWKGDGCFHYTGEGQRGDQQFTSGNRAILDHVAGGRHLRLFDGARGTVTYEGEMQLAADLPWYHTEAPETGGGPLRQVIVFRLQRVASQGGNEAETIIPAESIVRRVPIEEQHTERVVYEPAAEPVEADRREQRLVRSLEDYLRSKGHAVVRYRIQPAGEARPLYCDLFDETANVLVEAKGTVERNALRMAIGQLADYVRHIEGMPRRAVLLPERPRPDLLDLLASQDVTAVWPVKDGFADTGHGIFHSRQGGS